MAEIKAFELGPYGRNNHRLDIYTPSQATQGASLPALIYFHGGGLVVGSKSNVPDWNKKPALEAGVACISPDYSKLPGSTAFHLIQDAEDLFKYIGSLRLPNDIRIDTTRLAVVGSSAGCYVGRLVCRAAGFNVIKAIGLEWAMGGDMVADHWVVPHEQELPYFEQFPQNKGLFYDWLKEGNYLDYFTGQQGLSKRLRHLEPHNRFAAVPTELLPCFVQQDTDKLPPTAIVHGALDSLVPPSQSFAVADTLNQASKEYRMEIVEGLEHSFWPAKRSSAPIGDKAGAMARLMTFILKAIIDT